VCVLLAESLSPPLPSSGMSRFSLLLALLLVTLSLVAAIQLDDFENALSAEAPELVESSPDSFMTLSSLSAEEDPAQSFAELSSEAVPAAAATHSSTQALIEEKADSQHDPNLPWHRSNKNQPVARHNAEIKCLDGDCTRAIGVRKAKIGHHPNANTKPPPTKLDVALGAVKEEIMVRAKELHKEKDWSQKVATLIDEYQQKLSKVSNNIVLLRTQTKALLRKKKQIQNVQVQNKLRHKLKLAQADLNRLQKQMEHIAGKENEFSDTERQLKGTMNALKNSLLKLRGQEPQKLVQEGIELP